MAALQAVSAAVEALTPSTVGHSQRVADLAARLAVEVGSLPTAEIAALHEAALLHDVGKVAVPAEVLSRPGRLAPGELQQVRCHPWVGWVMVTSVLTPSQAQLVRHHHERWDGRGYPDAIRLRELSAAVSLLALADSFDAMVHRPHSGCLGLDQAIDECIRHSATQFAPAAVSALVRLADRGALPVGTTPPGR